MKGKGKQPHRLENSFYKSTGTAVAVPVLF
jgi:hypothetical protein